MLKITAIHRLITPLIFFGFSLSTLHAQYEYSVKNYNSENGLPQNEITAMSLDKDGYLWIGTRSGLVRYDGSGFKTSLSTKKNNNFLSTDILYEMYIPADKKLMVKTRMGDVYSIENGKPVLFSDSAAGVRDYMMILNGYFPSLGLYKQLHRTVFRPFDTKTLDQGNFNLLPVNKEDFLIGSVSFNKFFYFKNGVQKTTIELAANPKKIIASKGYQFLLDQENSLSVYDNDSSRFKKVTVDWQSIKSKDADLSEILFYSDPYSSEAFCFYNSMFYLLSFNPAQNLLSFIPQFSIKEKTHFWSGITYDSTNSTFFLSTPNEGFFQVRLNKIQTFNLIEKVKGQLKPGNIVSYTALKTSDSTVVVHNGTQFTVTSSGIKTNTLGNFSGESLTLGLLKDRSILCTYQSSLYYYSPKDNYETGHVFSDSFNRRFNLAQIESIYPEGDSVWVTSKQVFCCFTGKKMKVLFEWSRKRESPDSGFKNLRSFFRLNKDEAFVTNENGLYRLHTSPPYTLDTIPEMAGKFVRHINRYKDVLIISAYRDGLYVLKENRYYKVPVSSEFPEVSSCHSTYIDKTGDIWIPTDKGLFRSSANSLIESALKGTIPFFFYYGKADGIANTEFNGSGVPTYAVLRNEQLFYPSMGGIVTFRPGELNKKTNIAPVFIEKILIDNEETRQQSDSIYLPANFKYLAIDLNTPNFGEPRNLFLEYKFDSTGWKKIQPADNQRINLVNIASGVHRLIIRKRTGFGDSDYVYTKLIIDKKKGIYEQWWFALSVLIAFGLLYTFFVKMQTRSLNQKRKQLQKLVDEQTAELSRSVEVKDLLISIITHDMITPLRHVSLITSLLRKGFEKDPQKIDEALADVQSTSERIMSNSTSITNWIKYNNKQIQVDKKPAGLAILIDDVLELFLPIAKSKKISLLNEVSESVNVFADYTIFKTILNNIISNAIKHTSAGPVIFSTGEATGSGIVLKISDSGSGMTDEVLWVIREILKGNLQALKTTNKVYTGLGYIMIAELLKIHGLTINVESEVNRGTTVSIMMDTTENHEV